MVGSDAQLTFWLGAMTGCLALIAGTCVVTAVAVRRTLQHLNVFLPQCHSTLREAGKTLTQARQILSRTHEATRQVATVVGSTCRATSAFVHQVTGWTRGAQRWWTRQRRGFIHHIGQRRESA